MFRNDAGDGKGMSTDYYDHSLINLFNGNKKRWKQRKLSGQGRALTIWEGLSTVLDICSYSYTED